MQIADAPCTPVLADCSDVSWIRRANWTKWNYGDVFRIAMQIEMISIDKRVIFKKLLYCIRHSMCKLMAYDTCSTHVYVFSLVSVSVVMTTTNMHFSNHSTSSMLSSTQHTNL